MTTYNSKARPFSLRQIYELTFFSVAKMSCITYLSVYINLLLTTTGLWNVQKTVFLAEEHVRSVQIQNTRHTTIQLWFYSFIITILHTYITTSMAFVKKKKQMRLVKVLCLKKLSACFLPECFCDGSFQMAYSTKALNQCCMWQLSFVENSICFNWILNCWSI